MTLLFPWLASLGALIVIGFVLTLVLMKVRERRRDIERHVSLVSGTGGTPPTSDVGELLKQGPTDRHLVLGQHLRGIFGVGLARNWGMHAGALPLILAACGGGLVAWLVCHSALHFSDWISAAATIAATMLIPRAFLKHQQSAADKAFMEVFPESIDMVIRMLRAGLPIAAAVRAVGDEGPPPVDQVFTRLADQMAIGIPFEVALALAGERIGLSDFQFFAVAVSLQRATGGNLATTLDILSDLMRKRRATRLKAKATTGEVRMSAYVLGAIPFLVIGGLLVMTPDYLQPLIADPRGKMIIAVALVSMLTGFAIIRHMMRSVTQAG